MADDVEVERMPYPDPAGLDTEALIALLNCYDTIDEEIAKRLRAAEAERDAALVENRAMRKELEFYAEAEHWARYGMHDIPPCHQDGGRRARAVLDEEGAA